MFGLVSPSVRGCMGAWGVGLDGGTGKWDYVVGLGGGTGWWDWVVELVSGTGWWNW